jgi:hypothetical protein
MQSPPHAPAALNNCAFVSTENLRADPAKPFCFLMDASMLGVGCGFVTLGATDPDSVLGVPGPKASSGDSDSDSVVFVIPDSRAGWVDALRRTLNAWFLGQTAAPRYDYSRIRPEGSVIRGSGGVASGPASLRGLLETLPAVLDAYRGKPVSITLIVDIMNIVGKCVVGGNLRRTAEIAFGPADSAEYLDLKNYDVNPQRSAFSWTSNNSIMAKLGMNYADVVRRIRRNGEPGIAWLDNMRAYSRMGDAPDHKDARAMGGNPCLEQTLESYELCCLVETFPAKHSSREDFLETLKYAVLYAKTVTLTRTHWPEANRVMQRNRRIGCSVSGLAQFLGKHDVGTLRDWLDAGYAHVRALDTRYSEQFCVPRSIKVTSVKPSGTVSLLAGATPGLHFPESRYYVRRVRIGAHSAMVATLRDAGYPIEAAVDAADAGATVVVEIPVDAGEGLRTLSDVSMWEQLSLAALLQRHWADNQVSATVTFCPDTEGPQLESALDYFQYQLKGISFLPKLEHGAYEQMPYEEISRAEYEQRRSALALDDASGAHVGLNLATALPKSGEEAIPERFCDGGVCDMPVRFDGLADKEQ